MSTEVRSTKVLHVDILGKRVAVEFLPMADKFGDFDEGRRLIRLDPSSGEACVKSTLVHEMCHGGFFFSGLDEMLTAKQVEAVCRMVENLFVDYVEFPSS